MELNKRLVKHLGRQVVVAAGLAATLVAPRLATAGIISIKNVQSCGVIGLDATTAAARGGVHCDVGNVPFLLSQVLDGSIALLVGDDQTPSWNLKNDTGKALTSLTLYFSGSLASNAFVDMQVSGTTLFQACQTTTDTGVVKWAADCGSGDKTADNPDLPLQMTWSGGTGIAAGASFNLNTASFAHAGADAGCISGQANCATAARFAAGVPVPEPATLGLLGLGLVGVAVRMRRRAR